MSRIELDHALVDVFAERALEGNMLAIFSDARGLTTEQMQALARETNLAVEVLALTGDIAEFAGKPIVRMHAVPGRSDGTTVGGHVFELNVNPTLEVFVNVNTAPLKKKPDEASGMKLIAPVP